MTEYDITSPSNERIKRLVRLRNRRHRDQEGLFTVEGPRLLARALESGLQPIEIFTDGSAGNTSGTESVLVEPSVLDKASYRQSSQGVIAVFEQFHLTLDGVSLSSPALIIATEAIEKPGNLGAMMRTASAVGGDALITLGAGTDIFNPNVLRASTGAFFSLPCVQTDMGSMRSWLSANSISLFAASPEADRSIWDVDLTGSSALLIGAEDAGLSDAAIEIADHLVTIPMRSPTVDSLNASVSLAVFAYEALRQRRG